MEKFGATGGRGIRPVRADPIPKRVAMCGEKPMGRFTDDHLPSVQIYGAGSDRLKNNRARPYLLRVQDRAMGSTE